LVKKEAREDGDSEFENDWTFVDDNDEDEIAEAAQQHTVEQTMAGMNRVSVDGRMGSGSLALGSMVLKGASSPKDQASASRRE
jgi:sterol 3beta-glucosyltransferase